MAEKLPVYDTPADIERHLREAARAEPRRMVRLEYGGRVRDHAVVSVPRPDSGRARTYVLVAPALSHPGDIEVPLDKITSSQYLTGVAQLYSGDWRARRAELWYYLLYHSLTRAKGVEAQIQVSTTMRGVIKGYVTEIADLELNKYSEVADYEFGVSPERGGLASHWVAAREVSEFGDAQGPKVTSPELEVEIDAVCYRLHALAASPRQAVSLAASEELIGISAAVRDLSVLSGSGSIQPGLVRVVAAIRRSQLRARPAESSGSECARTERLLAANLVDSVLASLAVCGEAPTQPPIRADDVVEIAAVVGVLDEAGDMLDDESLGAPGLSERVVDLSANIRRIYPNGGLVPLPSLEKISGQECSDKQDEAAWVLLRWTLSALREPRRKTASEVAADLQGRSFAQAITVLKDLPDDLRVAVIQICFQGVPAAVS